MNQVRTALRSKKAAAVPSGRSGSGENPVLLFGMDSADARLRTILAAIEAFRDGDFTVRLPTGWSNVDAKIAAAFNQTIAQKQRISTEVARLSETVGKEGRLRQRMSLPGAVGEWAADVESINTLIDDLVRPTTEIARTIGAVPPVFVKGDGDG